MRHPRPAAFGALLLATTAAFAQSSPYTIGVSETVTHDTNLLRMRNGTTFADPDLHRSDTVSSTALVAGVDQMIGRQRLYGSGSVRYNRYDKNDQFSGTFYAANLGLDFATVERITGTAAIDAARTLRADLRDRFGRQIDGKNAEDSRGASLRTAIGMVTQWGLEVGGNARDVNYSADESKYREFDVRSAFARVRYMPGGSTTFGFGATRTRYEYPSLFADLAPQQRAPCVDRDGDRRDRTDADLTASWQGSGLSRVDARISRGKTDYRQCSERDFKATLGSLVWVYQATGKLRVDTRFTRDIGQDADVATSAVSRTYDSLGVTVNYQATAKIALTAGASGSRRRAEGTTTGDVALRGTDHSTNFSVGARWTPWRSTTLGCDISRQRRDSNSEPRFDDAYKSVAYGCNAQFALQL